MISHSLTQYRTPTDTILTLQNPGGFRYSHIHTTTSFPHNEALFDFFLFRILVYVFAVYYLLFSLFHCPALLPLPHYSIFAFLLF